MTTPTPPTDCPCGSGQPLATCCGRYHEGPLAGLAPTAEALMRSRYSAYVLDRLDYLLSTWHPDTRPARLAPNEAGLRWLGLTVRRHVPIDADHATVEFVARSKFGGRACRMHETSRFVREQGRWLYLDGNDPSGASGNK